MIKNKFHIGQKVVVLQLGKAVEGLICSIDESAEKTIQYTVKTVKKIKQSNRAKGNVVFTDTSHHWPDRFRAYVDPSVQIMGKYDKNVQVYKEQNIFEDEADFRTNVSIQRIPKKALDKNK